MGEVKKFFIEFKSIFTGEDVIKGNEEHANIVVATIMLNIFLLSVAICVLAQIGIFNINQGLMLDATVRSIFTLFIPSIIAFKLKGKGKYLKFVLLILLTCSIGSIYSLLTYTATLLLIIIAPIIIFAGYKEEMKNFIEINSGLMSRIGETIEFEDYNEKELLQIYLNEMEKSKFILEEAAKSKVMEIIEQNRKTKNFGNARFVINVFKKTLMQHAKRCRDIDDMKEIKRITIEDIPEIKAKKEKRIGF